MGDGNLHRIASRAFKDILFGNTNQKRGSHQKLTENLKDPIADSPIRAPIPASISAPVPAASYKISTELLEEQLLRKQQRNYYSPKSHFPIQKSSYSLFSTPTENFHRSKSEADEVHQLTSAMSHSITFTPDSKKKILPRSFSNSVVFQQNQSDVVNVNRFPPRLSDSISSDGVERKRFPGKTGTVPYHASQTFKSEDQWSISDYNTLSKRKKKAVCEKYSYGYNTTVKNAELDVSQSKYTVNDIESPELPSTSESVRRVVKLEYGSSNSSYDKRNIRIHDDISSPGSQPSLRIQVSSSKNRTPKRRFSEICDNQESDDQKFKSITDQTPYSPLLRTPRFQHSSYGYRPFLPNYNVQEFQTLAPDIGFIDTHCHLDFLFKRAHHNNSFEAYRKVLRKYFPVSYEGCVAVFCDPHTFARKNIWQDIIEEDGVWAAFGCHPHNAMDYNEEIHMSLIAALKHPKVRAFGEIGLDYSNRNQCPKAVQHKVFKRQLKLAIEKKLPLVIHNREAFEDCLEIMKKHVPLNYKIHLHCCTDPWEVAKTWLDTFSNLFIGLTNVITYSSAENVHNIARNIPLDRLLLETDTPYFLPRILPKSLRWSHPGMAIHVAAQVAVLRNISLEETLKAVRLNTKKMYNI